MRISCRRSAKPPSDSRKTPGPTPQHRRKSCGTAGVALDTAEKIRLLALRPPEPRTTRQSSDRIACHPSSSATNRWQLRSQYPKSGRSSYEEEHESAHDFTEVG